MTQDLVVLSAVLAGGCYAGERRSIANVSVCLSLETYTVSNLISNEIRPAAEFKHINKRSKRN